MLPLFRQRTASTPVAPLPARPSILMSAGQLLNASQAEGTCLLISGNAPPLLNLRLAKVCVEAGDCVIQLQGSDHRLPGFESAPFTGSWYDAGSKTVSSQSLDDVLASRRRGALALEVPPQNLTGHDLDDFLNATLLSASLHFDCARSRPPLAQVTLLVEASKGWLSTSVMTRLVAQARAFKIRVIFLESAAAPAVMAANSSQLVAFKSSDLTSQAQSAAWLGTTPQALAELAENEFFCRTAQSKTRGQPAIRCTLSA